MKRTRIPIDVDRYPAEFRSILSGAPIYDSSSSPEARVILIDRDEGYFLKSAPKGTLQKEDELTRFFHKKGLAAQVLFYLSEERDWLLTSRVHGEDCTAANCLEDPKRLCDTIAECLRTLHETDMADCPVSDRTGDYIATAERNYRAGMYDPSIFTEHWHFSSADEAWRVVEQGRHLLKKDVLLHGDYCLPNILLDGWKFSGFIDLGNGGVGDRHIDLFWGAWSLAFNLKTDKYRDRFFDAYGRADVDPEMLRIVAAAEVFG